MLGYHMLSAVRATRRLPGRRARVLPAHGDARLGCSADGSLRDRAADDEGEPISIFALNDDAGAVADALVAVPGTAPISGLMEAAWTVAGVTGWNSVLRCG
jgi:hypothetical protein